MTTNDEKPERKSERPDLEHELPPGNREGREGTGPSQQSTAETSSNLRSDLEKVTQERDALLDRAARLQAEFENSRKRADREREQFKEFALADAIKSMLQVLDSFDQALEAPANNVAEFRSGVNLIRRQFEDVLRKLGVSPIQAKGLTFDPTVHHAIETVDTTSANDGQVLEEVQRGYKMGDRLLRPAMVRVARQPKSDQERQAA